MSLSLKDDFGFRRWFWVLRMILGEKTVLGYGMIQAEKTVLGFEEGSGLKR